MLKLVRITSEDYWKYWQSYSKIEFSFYAKNQTETRGFDKFYSNELALEKEPFLHVLNQPDVEMYFIENDDETLGITVMQVMGEFCYLDIFAIFQKERGWGNKAFAILKERLKNKSISYIRLTCPFAGAQIFWKKQGFSLIRDNFYELTL